MLLPVVDVAALSEDIITPSEWSMFLVSLELQECVQCAALVSGYVDALIVF
jgi:hypothetical protein